MPKRDFPTLLTAFLAVAATGAAIGGPKEAKAATGGSPSIADGSTNVIICDDEFCQFFEDEFDQFSETLPFQEFFNNGGPAPFFEGFLQIVEPPPPFSSEG